MARDGDDVHLSARKARILLGLLACTRNRTMPRQRIASILWEIGDAEQARVSLRQALAQIRRAGGDGWVEAAGDQIRLGDAVETDVEAFQAALARNDPTDAVRRYRGPFLDGIEVNTPDLAQAIAAERARLAGLAVGALASELVRIGEGAEASTIAHRLLGLDPLNELAHRCLMQIDAARGMRAAARTRYESLEATLQRDLGIAPEDETQALYERIRRGARGNSPRETSAKVMEDTIEPDLVAEIRLVGMETGLATPDWAALKQRAAAGGATEVPSGTGELLLTFTGQPLWQISNTALQLAEAGGQGLSFGMLEAESSNAPAPSLLARGRRMAAMAEPGEVLVARELASRLGLAAEPGQNAVVLRPDAARARPDLPIIGRAAELAQITAAIEASYASELSLAIHLSGEAGIGKSRLTDEIVRRAATSGVTTLSAGFEAFSPGSRHIAQRLMASFQVSADLVSSNKPVERAIWSWLTDPEMGHDAELWMNAINPDAQRDRILDVMALALRQVTAATGLLIVIEDCHWRPNGAGDFILELLSRLQDSRVTFLLTERPHDASLDHRLSARSRSGLLRIALAPLSHACAHELVRVVAPDFTSPEAAIARAAGHPLFLIRLLESNWTDGALPATVTELVQEQIERLPDAERASLRKAAILGATFRPEDASAVFPEITRLRSSGDLLYETGDGLAFGHDLLHRAIYEAIPPETRQAWHARAAANFRSTDPILWAEHALKAVDDADATMAASAAANAMFAARRFTAAFPYIEAGLARDGDHEASAELYSCRAGIRRVRGDMAGALDDYRSAHAQAIHDETRTAMLVRQALVLHRLGRGDEADRTLDAAEEIADSIGLTGQRRAEIHEQRGNRAFGRGDHAACLAHHEAALSAAETTGDPMGIARAHGGIGDASYAAGRFATAYRHFTMAIEFAEKAGLGLVREEFLFMRAFSLFFADPGPAAFLLADMAVDSAIQCGASRTETIAREVRAEMRLANGDLEGLEEDLEAMKSLSLLRGESRFSKDVDSLDAYLSLRRGNADVAREKLAPLLPDAESDPYIGGTLLGLAALLAMDPEERNHWIAAGERCLANGSLAHAVIWFHATVLERAIIDGDRELGRRHIDALAEFAKPEPIGLVSLIVRTAELSLWPETDAERAAHAAMLEQAGLGDPAQVLMKSGPGQQ